MNEISYHKMDLAIHLASQGRSVREISRMVGIARETAHRIQKSVRLIWGEDGDPIPMRKGGYWDHKKHYK